MKGWVGGLYTRLEVVAAMLAELDVLTANVDIPAVGEACSVMVWGLDAWSAAGEACAVDCAGDVTCVESSFVGGAFGEASSSLTACVGVSCVDAAYC